MIQTSPGLAGLGPGLIIFVEVVVGVNIYPGMRTGVSGQVMTWMDLPAGSGR